MKTTMPLKYLVLDDGLYGYLRAQRSSATDPVLGALRNETAELGEDAKCQISEEQGAFMSLLVRAIGAKEAIEVGTFTGYSSICIARGLAKGGRLICVDQNKEWTDMARRYWARAGVTDKIELRLGSALPILEKLEPGLAFDFAFIDAAKNDYDQYYELILPRVRPNGLILFDNMLWGGRLRAGQPPDNPLGRAIYALNEKLANDPRVEAVLLPVADGIQVCRKR
jgi:caffeoyl-CoA O-methyltransferase